MFCIETTLAFCVTIARGCVALGMASAQEGARCEHKPRRRRARASRHSRCTARRSHLMTSTPIASSRRARRGLLGMLFCPPLLLLSASVHAQDMTDAGAQLLDAEGTALLNQHQLAAACPKLEQSFRLKPGIGVLLRLALCQELSGKGASAHAHYLEAEGRARTAGNPQIVQLAQKRAAALASRLSHLRIELAASVEALANVRISLDGAPLEATTWRADMPLDPGSHVIEAEAPGRKRFEKTIVVGDEPQQYAITVTLAPAEVEVEPNAVLEPQPKDTKSSPWTRQRSLALVAGGIGLAGVTAGTFLGLAVGSQMRRARALCENGTSGCPEEALALQDQAHGYSLASTISFSVGTAAILGGVALWLTAPPRPERPLDAQVRVLPIVGSGAAGIQAVGKW